MIAVPMRRPKMAICRKIYGHLPPEGDKSGLENGLVRLRHWLGRAFPSFDFTAWPDSSQTGIFSDGIALLGR
jgi:hypothetical protein